MDTSLAPRPVLRRPRLRPLRWLAAPLAAVIFALGVWFTGSVTSHFTLAMALTAVWFAFAGLASLALGLKRYSVGVPVIAGYVLSAGLVGGYLAYTTSHTTVAHEKVVTGVAASALRTPARSTAPASPGQSATAQNVQLESGTFVSGEHASRGIAAVVRLPDGTRILTFTRFSTSPGPDLRVRLVPGNSTDGTTPGTLDLGSLKGNKGNQQYKIPRTADLTRYQTAVVWCRAFTVAFASAQLHPS
jgi:Electron transfer DM13